MDYTGRKTYNAPIETSVTTDKRKQKKLDKNSKKSNEAYEQYLESVQNSKIKVPPARVKHDKTDSQGKTMDIFIDNLNIIVGGKTLLEDTQLKMSYGRKYGLIGRNGIGKTCLMNSLALRELNGLPEYIQILLVEQEIEGNDKTPLDLVLETDGERTELMQQQEELAESNDIDAAEKMQAIFDRLEQIEAASAESRAQKILHGLGFSEELMKRKSKHLSGGWRMRISLGRALFVQPDILLLDEPTNHLDLDAVIWLQQYCVKCEHTVIVVSHDREFLNVVCDEMIHFFDRKLTNYKGNYDQYEKTRSEKLTNQQKQYDKQQIEIAHMQSFVDRFRANAARASQAQSRVKALQKMELIDEVLTDPSCVFYFPQPDNLQNPLLRIEDGEFQYNEQTPILQNVNFNVEMDSRIAILGANGAGKSTLLGILVEKLKLTEGEYYKNARMRISLFTQHHMEQLSLMLTPVEQLQQSFPGSLPEKYRGLLSQFGLVGEVQIKPQYLLSGGQKSRVAFAMAVWNNPHILIMDEPTNHLDIDAVNALIAALNEFKGALIIVSHDQYFVSTVCNEIWYIKDYNLNQFDGEFQDYVDALVDGKL